jgi:hypothetical protein
MFEKKVVVQGRINNHAGSTHSPSSHIDKSPLTLTSSDSHRSPACRSISRGHRISAHKLFEKAHLAKEGETYLRGTKGERSS